MDKFVGRVGSLSQTLLHLLQHMYLPGPGSTEGPAPSLPRDKGPELVAGRTPPQLQAFKVTLVEAEAAVLVR